MACLLCCRETEPLPSHFAQACKPLSPPSQIVVSVCAPLTTFSPCAIAVAGRSFSPFSFLHKKRLSAVVWWRPCRSSPLATFPFFLFLKRSTPVPQLYPPFAPTKTIEITTLFFPLFPFSKITENLFFLLWTILVCPLPEGSYVPSGIEPLPPYRCRTSALFSLPLLTSAISSSSNQRIEGHVLPSFSAEDPPPKKCTAFSPSRPLAARSPLPLTRSKRGRNSPPLLL